MQKFGIRVLRHSAFYSPLIVTIGAGFLKQQGFDVHYDIADADNSIEKGIADGSVQVAQSAPATTWMALERDRQPNFVHFAQINQRDGFFLTRRHGSEAFDWQEIKGHDIVADHFFQPLAMFKYALHKNSISLDQVNLLDKGDVGAMDKAYRAGCGDYVHQQGPAAQQLEKDGLGTVCTAIGDTIGPVAFSSLCAAPEWLSSDMAAAFLAAYTQGRELVQQAPVPEIAGIIQGFFPDIDHAVLCDTLHAYKTLGCWDGSAAISRESYDNALDIFAYNGLISRRYEYTQTVQTIKV